MRISASSLGQFVALGFCGKYLARSLGAHGRGGPGGDDLDPVLKRRGELAQQELREFFHHKLGSSPMTADLTALIRDTPAGQTRWAEEVAISGSVGNYEIGSEANPCRMDFVIVRKGEDGGPADVTVIECKSSDSDRLSHRVQLAIYLKLAEQCLVGKPVRLVGEIRRRPPPIGSEEYGLDSNTDGAWTCRSLDMAECYMLCSDLVRMMDQEGGDGRPLTGGCGYCRYNSDCLAAAVKADSPCLLSLSEADIRSLCAAGLKLSQIADGAGLPTLTVPERVARARAEVRSAYYAGRADGLTAGHERYLRIPRNQPMVRIYLSVLSNPLDGQLAGIGYRITGLGEPCEAVELAGDEGELQLLRTLAAVLTDLPQDGASHVFTWSEDDITKIIQRLHTHRATDADQSLCRLAAFLTQEEGGKFGENNSDEQWIRTALGDEIARRRPIGCIGTSLLEVSVLDWPQAREIAAIWLCSDNADTLRDVLGQDQLPQSLEELRTTLRQGIRAAHTLSPAIRERLCTKPGEATAWMLAEALCLEKLEVGLRQLRPKPVEDLVPEKRPVHISAVQPTDAFALSKAIADYAALNDAWRRTAVLARLMRSPNELLRDQKVVQIASLVRDRGRVLAKIDIGGNCTRQGVEDFKDKVEPGMGPSLIIQVSKDKMHEDLTTTTVHSAWFVTGGRWNVNQKTSKSGNEPTFDGQYLQVLFNNTEKRPPLTLGSGPIPKTIPVSEDTVLLWAKDASASPERSTLLKLAQTLAPSPCPYPAVGWFDGVTGAVPKPAQPMDAQEQSEMARIVSQLAPTYRAIGWSEGEGDLHCGSLVGALDRQWNAIQALRADKIPSQPDDAVDGAVALDRFKTVLENRITLVQGPPGTGKTDFGASALLLWLFNWKIQNPDKTPTVLLVAHTHLAVEELLKRLVMRFQPFRGALADPSSFKLTVVKIGAEKMAARNSSPGEEGGFNQPEYLFAAPTDGQRQLAAWNSQNIRCYDGYVDKEQFRFALTKEVMPVTGQPLLVGVTATSGRTLQGPLGHGAIDLLVIDEGSMMTVADFYQALPFLRQDQGKVLILGDDRQISPIVNARWHGSVRPAVSIHRPFESVFARARRLLRDKTALGRGGVGAILGLDYCFRCPEDVWRLFRPIYLADGIELRGKDRKPELADKDVVLRRLLTDDWEGVRLVTYDPGAMVFPFDEATVNPLELEIVRAMLGETELRGTIALIAPYRRQKAALSALVPPDAKNVVAATVNKMQGAQRDTIVLSMTGARMENDHHAEFLLDLNRTNVAISRAANRLVIVCSITLLEHVPRTARMYDATMLWRNLAAMVNHVSGNATIIIGGRDLKVLVRRPAGAVVPADRQGQARPTTGTMRADFSSAIPGEK